MKSNNSKELATIGRFLFSAGSSFALDLVLFAIFQPFFSTLELTKPILLATISARVISSLYNYWLNSRFVFRNHTRWSMAQYYLLAIVQMLISAFLVNWLATAFPHVLPVFIKAPIEIAIFIANYLIQRLIIFRHATHKDNTTV